VYVWTHFVRSGEGRVDAVVCQVKKTEILWNVERHFGVCSRQIGHLYRTGRHEVKKVYLMR
jgi:hypothetical protein